MKKNNKGFSLIETLIVSAFVVTSLIYLYRQITTVKTSYDISFRYNTVEGLYGADIISDYLKDNGYTKMIRTLSNTEEPIIRYCDITNNTNIDFGSSTYYNDLIDKLDVKLAIFTNEDLTDLIAYLDSDSVIESDLNFFGDELDDLLNFMEGINADGLTMYRIIVLYEDNTFATIQFS